MSIKSSNKNYSDDNFDASLNIVLNIDGASN